MSNLKKLVNKNRFEFSSWQTIILPVNELYICTFYSKGAKRYTGGCIDTYPSEKDREKSIVKCEKIDKPFFLLEQIDDHNSKNGCLKILMDDIKYIANLQPVRLIFTQL